MATLSLLLCLVDNVNNPDPIVQSDNIAALLELAAIPSAFDVAVSVLIERPPIRTPHRVSTVARQLLRSNPSLVLSTDLPWCTHALFAAMGHAEEAYQEVRDLAMMLSAMASTLEECLSQSQGAAQTAAYWDILVSALYARSHPQLMPRDGLSLPSDMLPATPLASLWHVAVTLRLLAEDAAAGLRREVGGSPQTCQRLCEIFCQCLRAVPLDEVLLAASGTVSYEGGASPSRGETAVADLLLAFGRCLAEGVLPTACPTGIVSPSGPEPAAAALQEAVHYTATVLELATTVAASVLVPRIHNLLQLPASFERGASLLQVLMDFISHIADAATESEALTAMVETLLSGLLSCLLILWRQSSFGSVSGAVERAVMTSLTLLAELAHSGVGSGAVHASLSEIIQGLFGLATLPPAVAHSPHLEYTVDRADTEADVRITVNTTRSQGTTPARVDGSKGQEDTTTNSEGDNVAPAGTLTMAGLLEDNGMRRDAIAWLLNCLSMSCVITADDLSHALVRPGCAAISAHLAGDGQPTMAEAILFMVNEVMDEHLSGGGGSSSDDVSALAEVALLLQHRLSLFVDGCCGTPGRVPRHDACMSVAASGMPCYLRLQATRFLARLVSSSMQMDDLTTHNLERTSLRGSIRAVVMPSALLESLALLVSVETNKMVQVGALQDFETVVSACSVRRVATATSIDSEEASDASVSSDDGSYASSVPLDGLPNWLQFNTSLNAALRSLLTVYPSLQMGPRTALCHVLGSIFPQLAAACLDRAAVPMIEPSTITATLEALAHQFMQVAQSEATLHSVEAATILNCLCDVSVSVGGHLLPALSWLAQVFQHVVRCADAPSAQPPGNRGSMSATDMLMLATDLLSCACDALLLRDTLTATQGQDPTAQQQLAALQEILTVEAVGIDCIKVLSHVLQTEAAGSSKDDAELRRALFALLYDVVYIDRPHGVTPVVLQIVNLCVAELAPLAAASMLPDGALCLISRDPAAANALLCLSEGLFYLYDDPTVEEGRVSLPAGLPVFLLDAAADSCGVRDLRRNIINALIAVVAYQSRRCSAPTSSSATVRLHPLDVTARLLRTAAIVLSQDTPRGAASHFEGYDELSQALVGLSRILGSVQASAGGDHFLCQADVFSSVATCGALAGRCLKCLGIPSRTDGPLRRAWGPVAAWVLTAPPAANIVRSGQRRLLALLCA